MKGLLISLVLAVTLCVLGGPFASAEPIPQFGFQWSPYDWINGWQRIFDPTFGVNFGNRATNAPTSAQATATSAANMQSSTQSSTTPTSSSTAAAAK